ncbi:MAG: WG repeat-containing protein, partial [Firmicutes bacterium]|nr:WG repeat-containing protein [Bacillota bacterium]
ECIYEDALYFEEGYCPVKKDGKWGLINEDGEEITGFVFDKMSSVYDGKVAVMIDGQFGIINFGDATEVSKEAFGEFLTNINNQ